MERVAILGGGAGGLTAAFELTATPELRERYAVTVYEMGHRLGGKGASGRRADGSYRIEEHGLHIWFGFYENAFAVMRRVYEELDRPPESPIVDWRDAFSPCHDVVLFREVEGAWTRRRWHFPDNGGQPGTPSDQSFRSVVLRVLEWLRASGPGKRRQGEQPQGDDDLGDAGEQIDAALKTIISALDGGDIASAIAGLIIGDELKQRGMEALLELLEGVRDATWAATAAAPAWRDYAQALDLFTTIFHGLTADDLLERGFAPVNDEELRDWLRRHGAKDETVDSSPMLRAFYDLCFAYADGDRRRPQLAASKALQAMLRIASGYQGAVMWKMQAGMGDAIFAPLYEVLKARGVRFEFFHRVQRLRVADGEQAIGEVEVVPQVATSGEYRPLVDVRGLPSWPSAPDWDQLPPEARGHDFERAANPLGAAPVTLRRGTDFDHVVLAIPPGGLLPMCEELAARDDGFATMLRSAHTVATQALQVWLATDADELGWRFPGDNVAGAYVPPLDTYCDMTHLIPCETWPPERKLQHIAYFCGVMHERPDETPEQATERAAADAERHLTANVGALWPGYDEKVVLDRYWRANTAGSERYVLTPPGTVTTRLRSGESGFENLALAGDWTRNGICGGSVEAAVTSGRMAARAISGQPAEIPGLDGWLEAD